MWMRLYSMAGQLWLMKLMILAMCVDMCLSTMCYQCDSYRHQRDCIHITSCPANETCFVHRTINGNVTSSFYSGCMERSTCPYVIPEIIPSMSRTDAQSDADDQTGCLLCCDGDYCNYELCDRPTMIGDGPRCLSCKHVNSPSDCRTIVRCMKDELCYTEYNPISRDFRMGCVTRTACTPKRLGVPIVGRRNAEDRGKCAKCCNSDHCNAQVCNNNQQQSQGVQYVLHVDQIGTVLQCQDTSYEACQLIANSPDVGCANSNTKRICPKTCNSCDVGCYDAAEFNCSEFNRIVNICDNIPQAMHYCQKTCDYCDKARWPPGTYMMVSADSGCPGENTTWTEVQILQEYPAGATSYKSSSILNLKGTMNGTSLKFSMCNRTEDILHYIGRPWPRGNYCIITSGIGWNRTCPAGFARGNIHWWMKGAKTTAVDMTYNVTVERVSHLLIVFCCRADNNPDSPIWLPDEKPFYLLKYTEKCQSVYNMKVTEEYVEWPTTDQDAMVSSCSGAHPKDNKCTTGHKLYLCYYFR